MKDLLSFFIKGSEVVRYHTVYTLQRETVGHHSHGVAMLCFILHQGPPRAALLKAALLHDLAEHVTGDIPSPAKRLYGIGGQVSSVESELLQDVGFGLPQLTLYEGRILKLADIAQGALFCAREVQLGNREMRTVLGRYLSYARELDLNDSEQHFFQLIQEMSV